MATTTNYSWTTPDDTDLVKDGAAAIRTLGSSADTTVKALNPGTTAGDVDYYTTSTAKARLAIGTAGQVLQVNSGATAPEWATPVAGGMTLINTGGTTLSGATTTISSIPSGYKKLELHVVQYQPATDGSYISIRFNADTNTRYVGGVITGAITGSFNATQIYISDGTKNTDGNGFIRTEILGYDNTSTWTIVESLGFNRYTGSATNYGVKYEAGAYNQLTAVTSITFQTNSGNITSGTAYLYGVN